MKRIVMLLLAVVLCFGVLAVEVGAAEVSGECGENLTWVFDEDTGTLTISGSGNMEDYSSASYQPWYGFSEKITRVVVEEGVTYIGNDAFSACYGLVSAELPESLTEIGYNAFYECGSLKEITIPDAVTCLGSRVFYECKALTQVKLPAGITEIPWDLFSGCSRLKSVEIPEKVTAIRSYAFYNCSGLADVTIPDGVIEIEVGAFSFCTSLTSIEIPDSVTLLDEFVFDSCTKLASVKLPANIRKISTALFQGCAGLKSVVIPERVVRIENNAFFGCSSLTSLDIPEGVTGVGELAFAGCTGLTAVVIPERVTGIGESTFHHCRSLASVDIPESVTSIGNYAFADCESLTAIALPENVEEMGAYAFYGCYSLRDVWFRGNRCSIGEYAFQDVWNATAYYPAGNTTWTEEVMQNYGGNLTWKSCCMNIPHEQVVDPAVAPTCTEIGFTEGIHCANCEYMIQAQGEIPATGVHTYENGKCKTCGAADPNKKMDAPKITGSNAASSGKNKISWNGVVNAVKYEVYRSTKKTSGFGKIATTTKLSYTDTKAEVGKLYYYKVKAADGRGNVSDFSNRVSRTCDLARPVVKASNDAATGKVKLTWAKIDGAKSYKVYRATSQNGKYTLMKTVTGTTYTNTSAKAGTKYFYKVIAVHENVNANSAYSVIVSRMADLARPNVTVKISDSGKPRISWQKVEGAVKYEVYRATSKNGTYTKLVTTQNTYQVNKNAVAGKTYYYKVKAIHSNTNANSALSLPKYIKAK